MMKDRGQLSKITKLEELDQAKSQIIHMNDYH